MSRIDEPVQSSQEDDQTVDAVVTWLKSADVGVAAEDSPYLHNLSAMAIAGSVPGHKVGLMASAVQAWKRAQAKRAEETVSQFVGDLGKRCDFKVTLVRTTDLHSEWGTKTLHNFIDEAGNRLVWFSTGYSPLRIGQTYHITAKVEKHQIYKDAFQTVLSRVTCQDLKLLEVTIKGDVKKLKKLLSQGLEVNVRNPDNRCPLHEAVLHNNEDVTAVLLDARACPDVRTGSVMPRCTWPSPTATRLSLSCCWTREQPSNQTCSPLHPQKCPPCGRCWIRNGPLTKPDLHSAFQGAVFFRPPDAS
jgi:hypothetical protein